MGVKQFDTRIQMKRDSATNWTSANPVLLNGEIIVVDTNSGDIRYKVGDGVKTYTQLPFSDESLIASMLSLNGGTMNGNINMSNHKITGLGAPVNPSDAVRQQDLEVLSNEIDDIIEGTTAITLPIADETKLGGVKIGEGINVDGEGTISAENQLPTGTQGQYLGFTADNVVGAVDGPEGLPSGGTEGQMLYQGANGAEWGDKPVMYVNITESGGTYSADKTAQEIYEAYQSGYAVFAVPFDTDIPIMSLYNAIKGEGANEYVANFSSSIMQTFYSVLINDSSNYVAFGSANLNADDISFTPTSPLTSDNVQDAIEEVYTKTAPTHQTITLSSSAWSSNSQTVTVSGVTADELDQLITPTPAIASQSAYYEAGIMCTNQGTNSLTFTCQTVPTSNLTVYVVIQPLG